MGVPKETNRRPVTRTQHAGGESPTLVPADLLLIFLLAAMVTLFVFWLAGRLGVDPTFGTVPDWAGDAVQAWWSWASVAAAAALVSFFFHRGITMLHAVAIPVLALLLGVSAVSLSADNPNLSGCQQKLYTVGNELGKAEVWISAQDAMRAGGALQSAQQELRALADMQVVPVGAANRLAKTIEVVGAKDWNLNNAIGEIHGARDSINAWAARARCSAYAEK